FAISYGVYWHAVIQGLVFIISSYYHFHHEKRIEYIDVFASSVLIIANFTLLFLGHWHLPFSILAFPIGAMVALYFYYRQFKGNYNVNHGLWHICSAIISTLCVITFLSGK
ncbi:MAG TPA: hypothetical protein PKZ56_00435, partial [Candidatus Paceibacterota bacterium]|nr:hypothetical protein [Candidatus Paceibacterota bacterium]